MGIYASQNGKKVWQSPRDYSLVVHSHLRWDWVWQRPQQLLSRLSKKHPILFVEEPVASDALSESQWLLQKIREYPGVFVLQITLPSKHKNKRLWTDAERLRIVRSLLAGPLGKRFKNRVQWFYDPMAVTAFAGKLEERAIVYDCMDQLSQFKGAPPQLLARERDLLELADVVFAGGPKIYKAKAPYNPNCHSYGCGVDEAHFGLSRKRRLGVPGDITDLQGPILGYFGVVDERMDYDLLAKLADFDPFWNIVIVGPRLKVDESVLPRRPNLRWLGGREYAVLPLYASRFDVCLMPFALNDATEFINPTKALEYMATGRPVVSSAIEDVVLQFSHVVSVGRSHDEFIRLCRMGVRQPNKVRIQRGIELARQNSWDAIVKKLESHIAEVLEAKQVESAGDVF